MTITSLDEFSKRYFPVDTEAKKVRKMTAAEYAHWLFHTEREFKKQVETYMEGMHWLPGELPPQTF